MRLTEGLGYQMNGLDLSGDDGLGNEWLVFNLDGWDNLPPASGEVFDQEFSDGGWITPAYYEPLTLRLTGRIFSADRPSSNAAIRQLNRALPMKMLAPVVVQEDGKINHRWVRVSGAPAIDRPTDRYVTFDVTLIAPDPRQLAGDGSAPYQYSASAFLPSTVGGLELPVMAPFTIGATVINGSVTVTADGDAQPPVLVRINGPAVQPIIRDQDGGAMPLDISLDAGQWLDVDLDAKTIKINSTVNRRNLLRGPWITPRSGMVLSLDAAVYNPLTSMTVFWTDASY